MSKPSKKWMRLLLLLCCLGQSSCYRLKPERRPAPAQVAQSLPVSETLLSLDQKRRWLERLQKQKKQPDTIQAGDGFNLTVYNEPELSAKGIIVQPDGYLNVPLMGPLNVQGVSVEDARLRIEASLKNYVRNPHVNLSPFQFKGRSFTLMGKVNKPGSYGIERPMKLLEAMGMGGGLAVGIIKNDSTELADLKGAYMIRDEVRLPIDFYALVKQGQTRYNIPILPGDYIYIPSVAQQEVYVLGEVLQQNAFHYREGMTLSQVLSYAKGIQPGAYLKQTHLIRGSTSNPERYILNYDAILDGTATDVLLLPGDVVYLPPGPTQRFETVMKTVLPLLQAVQGGALIYEVIKSNQSAP